VIGKRIFAGVMLGWSLLVGVALAESPDKLPKPTTYVSDFANVMDAGSKQSTEDLCRQVHIQTQAAIHVVTINSLDGLTIEDFTTQLEDNWKVGPKGTDKGVVLVFAIKEHKRRIEVGYGLEGILNDAKVGDIGRSMVPQLQQNAYGPAILSGVQQVANVIAADANVTLTQTQPQHTYRNVPAPSHGFPWGRVIFCIILFLLFARGGSSRGWFWFLLGNFMGGSGSSRGGDGGGSGRGSNDDFGSGFGGGSGGGGASGDW
jgi:uncharacterized protein